MSDSTEKPKAADAAKGDEDMLMDHEYDGIQEYDNPLPRWWVWIFWGSVVWSAGYYVVYHVTQSAPGVLATYEADVKAAGANAPKAVAATEEGLTKAMADGATVAAGKAVFAARCVACHADKGQGLVGPNLTDKHWIHGTGKLMDIHKTVAEGVAAKGMPAWEKQLTPTELTQVVSYVGTIRNKMETGKAPEGTEVTGN